MTELSKVVQLDSSNEEWSAFVASVPHANIFHHPAWLNLLAECYGYRPFILALFDDEEHLCAGLPTMEVNSLLTGKRWVSLPFTDHCQPLYRGSNALERLSREIAYLSNDKSTPRMEVRWELPACSSIRNVSYHVQHVLRLNSNVDSVSKVFHRTQRQNIKTAEKNGVYIEWGKDLDHLRVFYRLQCLTRRRQGVPVQPWRFFELLWKSVIDKGLGFILLAHAGDRCLAAGLFLHWKQTLSYKYAASGETGQDLRPNHLLTWTAIRWGCENGVEVLDFGRTDVGNEGLRTFKNRWGAEETPLTYSILSAGPSQPSQGRLAPVMQAIIRNSPPWVCRSAGELLYRHFG